MPIDQLLNAAKACAWVGCTTTFQGEMPKGWTWNVNYWDRTSTIGQWTTEEWAHRAYHDCALCPEHSLELMNRFKGSEFAALDDPEGRA